MKITLKSLQLTNFKRAKNVLVKFNPDITIIAGENGSGKTTIFDAYSWLLFGKDSYDRKDFNIKTLDADNNVIHKLEHSVTGVLDVDGTEVKLQRIYKEKWVKAKGAETAELTGHETSYMYNDVPVSQSEYKAKIDAMMPEETMKLISNPMYFNTNLKWTDRRNILMGIVGEISNSDILAKIQNDTNSEDVQSLMVELNNGKAIAEYKAQLSAKRRLLNEELKLIPARIDEAGRTMPEVHNWAKIEAEIVSLKSQIANIDAKLEDEGKAYRELMEQAQQLQQRKYNLQMRFDKAKNDSLMLANKERMEIENSINTTSEQIKILHGKIQFFKNDISRNNNIINTLTETNKGYLEQWKAENARKLEISESQLNCPACKQPLPAGDAEIQKDILTANFNGSKQGTLQMLEKAGKENKEKINVAEETVKDLTTKIGAIELEISQIEQQQAKLKARYVEIASDSQTIEPSELEIELQNEINSIVIPEITQNANDELKSSKKHLEFQIEELKSKLINREQINTINDRIKELESREKVLAQEISGIERKEFVIQSFETAQINELEARIEKLFPDVQFKLFNRLLNGGYEPCCETLIGGVPFSDANTAAKINAGLSIINVLSGYYKMSAPVFIDNKESVNNPISCNSQTIFLMVSYDSALTVQ